MGSVGNKVPVNGTFDIPIYEDEIEGPSERAYLRPPAWSRLVKRTYPLIDFRNDVFGAGQYESPSISRSAKFLSKYGFTAVKKDSILLSSGYTKQDLLDPELIKRVYYPEVESLIKNLTGCSQVFVDHSFVRGPMGDGADGGREEARDRATKKLNAIKDNDKSYHLTEPLPPTRVPHIDCTPLGGRSAVRCWREDFHAAAMKAGIIEAEDKICDAQGVKAVDKDSDAAVARGYNRGDSFGPRYASYSVWRPTKKVTRDPLAMAVRKNLQNIENNDLLLWSYEVRVPGKDGDWNRELEMLRVKPDRVGETKGVPREEVDDSIDWYYLPEQEPDEVLVFKLFDSAGLDASAQESEGAPHGSPDLGDAGYGDARESIEVRLYAIW